MQNYLGSRIQNLIATCFMVRVLWWTSGFFRVGLRIVLEYWQSFHIISFRTFIALEIHTKHGNKFKDEDVQALQVLFEQTDWVDLAPVRPGTSGINDSFLCYSVSLSYCHALKPCSVFFGLGSGTSESSFLDWGDCRSLPSLRWNHVLSHES